MKLQEVIARTDVGKVRDHNEDNHLVAQDLGLLAVADGMGGLALGEVASATAVKTLEAAAEVLKPLIDTADENPTSANRIQLAQAMEVLSHISSQRIQQATQGQASGTTLVSGVLTRGHLVICHVGDSRAYLFRDGHLRPITQDHTIAAVRLRQGLITKKEHDQSPYQHMLYQALGTQGELDPDLLDIPLATGDIVLLCSDGLTGPVSDEALTAILSSTENLDDAAEKMMAEALKNGGPDNITLLLTRVEDGPAGAAADSQAEILASCSTFGRLSDADHLMLPLFLEEVTSEEGDVFELERGVHILLSGTAQAGAIELNPGDAFGVALFADGSSEETQVTATSTTHSAVLTQDAFETLEKRRPTLAARMLRGMLSVLAT